MKVFLYLCVLANGTLLYTVYYAVSEHFFFIFSTVNHI